jgi:hypothetical protein
MRYFYLKDRYDFKEFLDSKTRPTTLDECYLCERDALNRVVGAFAVLDHRTYLTHLDLIDRQIVKRNNSVRRLADVPEYDRVKNLRLTIDGKGYNLYHRTHLVPFRFCLNDGSIRNLLFTATARLNSGLRIEDHYVPEKFQIDDNVEMILDKIKTDQRYFEDLDSTKYLALSDFERAASCILFRDEEHVFKYGSECIYDKESRIVSEIRLVMIDLTDESIVFSARLKNSI